MYVGLFVWPLHEIFFDSKIFQKSKSEKKVCKKKIYNQLLSDDAIINTEIMKNIGGWRERVHYNTLTFWKYPNSWPITVNLETLYLSAECLFMRVMKGDGVIIK